MRNFLLTILALLWLVPVAAHAQNTTCATRAPGDSSNACASTAFVHGGFQPTLPNFTANNPLIGNGTNVPTQGTRQGNTTVFPTIDGSSTNGNCAVWTATGGLSSAACSPSGSGTVGSGLLYQFAYYNANGTSVVGTPLMETPQMRGATGNGSTDDTTAINNWLADISSGHTCGFMPPGTYKVTAALTPITVGNWCWIGSGEYQSVISYQGASTTVNIFTLNCSSGSPCTDITFRGFSFTSTTTMTAGYGMYLNYIQYSNLRDIGLSGYQTGIKTMWNGIAFANASFNTWTGGDVFVLNNGISAWGGIELSLDQMRLLNNGNTAIYIGGGFGGLYLGYVTIFGGVTGLDVDTAVTSTGNAQIFISNRTAIDNAAADGIFLNDALSGAHSLSMDGWSSSCNGGGTCAGLAVNAWAGGNIQIGGGAQFINNQGFGLYLNDASITIDMDPATLIKTSGSYAVFCNVAISTINTAARLVSNGGLYGTNCHGNKFSTTAF